MSVEQRENLEAILRQSAFPAGGDVDEQRRQLRELISAQPLPAAICLARQAASADVEVTLDTTPSVPQSSRSIIRSSTKRLRRWTEPDSSCRHIWPAQNAPPPSERQNDHLGPSTYPGL